MDTKMANKPNNIEREMQKLKQGFIALKAKREALQKKIDAFKKESD